MIHVIATIEVHPGKRDAFLAEFRRLVPVVHAEAGCIEYGPTVDVAAGFPAQGPPRDNVAVIIEKWESLAALKAHMQAPHMAEYRVRVKDLVVGVQLQVLQSGMEGLVGKHKDDETLTEICDEIYRRRDAEPKE